MSPIKASLHESGIAACNRFLKYNELGKVEFCSIPKEEWKVGACAYYRPTTVKICLPLCAYPASENNPRQWSWPGTQTDRTPYGVIAHEVGHHTDVELSQRKGLTTGKYSGGYATSIREASGEKPLTSYCPNDGEWFAEMARLFILNPALLNLLRPRTFEELAKDLKPIHSLRSWKKVLPLKPHQRIYNNIKRKIGAVK